MVISAPLDNVRNCLAIDLKVSGKVPAEVRHSDHNETAIRPSRVGYGEGREEDENKNKSANMAD